MSPNTAAMTIRGEDGEERGAVVGEPDAEHQPEQHTPCRPREEAAQRGPEPIEASDHPLDEAQVPSDDGEVLDREPAVREPVDELLGAPAGLPPGVAVEAGHC